MTSEDIKNQLIIIIILLTMWDVWSWLVHLSPGKMPRREVTVACVITDFVLAVLEHLGRHDRGFVSQILAG